MIFSCSLQAQQSVQYSQFLLNDYGLNPAVAGSSKEIMFMVGRRTQWIGFSLAPETNFASVTKDFGKKGYRRYWHGVGAYVEQDKFGLFSSKSGYGSYAVHLKLSHKLFMSVGVAAGVKQISVSNSLFDANDPALNNRDLQVLLPSIVPGVYLYSKKLAISIAVRNLYQSRMKQGNKEIGGGVLIPEAYVTLSRKFRSPGYDYIFVPAIHIQSSFIGIPAASFNFMAFYRKRIGLGLTYRMHDAVAAIIQVRIAKNIVVGFSYDYTVSRFRSAKANSTEIMMGFSPIMSSDGYDGRNNVAECPKFEF